MMCPACGENSDCVIETKNRMNFIYRKRKCTKCGCRYFTHEKIVRPCAGWVSNDRIRVLRFDQLRSWKEAVWIETRSYGGNLLTATSIREVSDNTVRFENGEVRMSGLYEKQWRAWSKHPSKTDLNIEWGTGE